MATSRNSRPFSRHPAAISGISLPTWSSRRADAQHPGGDEVLIDCAGTYSQASGTDACPSQLIHCT